MKVFIHFSLLATLLFSLSGCVSTGETLAPCNDKGCFCGHKTSINNAEF